jgi:hypothetical protein
MNRPLRELQIPDDLWAPLGELADRLGIDRDVLVRQAIHAFLRFHGALAPGPITQGGGRPLPPLRLMGAAGLLATVAGDRFLIGRGRHCDLVIDSAKVSREHAAIQREPDGWWIEDLGSSNGTWYQRARVERRRIEHGDEYLICAEKIRCLLS